MNTEHRDLRMVRIEELERDGFITLKPTKSAAWNLTEKGWAALSAAAEPKIEKPTKPSP